MSAEVEHRHQCGTCGAAYTLAGWLRLVLRGHSGLRVDGVWRATEMRQCVCGSTLALRVTWDDED